MRHSQAGPWRDCRGWGNLIAFAAMGEYRAATISEGVAVDMKMKRVSVAVSFLFLLFIAQPLLAQAQGGRRGGAAAAAGTPAEPPAGRGTDQPSAEARARLQNGPAMNYKFVENWPNLPQGYNFGEC